MAHLTTHISKTTMMKTPMTTATMMMISRSRGVMELPLSSSTTSFSSPEIKKPTTVNDKMSPLHELQTTIVL